MGQGSGPENDSENDSESDSENDLKSGLNNDLKNDSGKDSERVSRTSPGKRRETVTVVVPVYNEAENLVIGCDEIVAALEPAGIPFEIVYVDDGSTDGGRLILAELAKRPYVRVVVLRRNYGQTAALYAGIQSALGDIVVTMDGDLQNDPRDIPAMVDLLGDDYDLVFGWRKDRRDKLLSRKVPSWIANKLIGRVTGFPIHDLGCTLKAIRSDIAKEMELYGAMHRFIPILSANLGARCVEMKVNHRSRQFGQSKYGIGRTIPVLLDLVTIHYMSRYFDSPMKLFGLFGFAVSALAVIATVATSVMKLFYGVDLTGNPITYFAIVAAILGFQSLSLGLLGELAVRIYYGNGDRKSYRVREFLGSRLGHIKAAESGEKPAEAGERVEEGASA